MGSSPESQTEKNNGSRTPSPGKKRGRKKITTRPEEKQKKEDIEKKLERLTETKYKFSLLKDEMLNITKKKAPPPQQSRCKTAGLAKERRRDTLFNWRNKRDEDNKPGMNMEGPIHNTTDLATK